MEKTTTQPKHPADRFADEYIKSLADNGWQMHRAYTQGFNTGAVHILVAQSQQLMKFAESDACPETTKPGIIECANYFLAISQGKTYQFQGKNTQTTTVEETKATPRELPKVGRGRKHREIEANA